MAVELEFDYDAVTSQMDIFSQQDVNALREWTQNLDKSKYVPKDLTDKQLVIFYNACYGDMEKIKACIERYYNIRKNTPEFFENRFFDSEDLRSIESAVEFAILPGKSVEGFDILFHRLHETEPSRYRLEYSVKLMFMTIDACLSKRGPQPGYMFLFDMRGVRLGHLTRISLTFLRKFFQYIQEALPVRMRAIHVLNTEPILDKVLLLIKPFIEKKFFDMIKFHHKEEDLEVFYETVLPKSCLPPDYGGSLPDTQTLHKKCMQQLRAMEPYFRAEEAQRIAALPDKKREKALERSFHKLDID